MVSQHEEKEALKRTAALHMAIISQAAKDILAARKRLKMPRYSANEKRRAKSDLAAIDRWSKITSNDGNSLLSSVKLINAYFASSDREPIQYHVVRELLFQDPSQLDIPIGGNSDVDDAGSASADRSAVLWIEGYSAYLEDQTVQPGRYFPVAEQVQFDI